MCDRRIPYVSAEILRVGDGLTRQRGQARVQTQMVGPLAFQYGNGDRDMTPVSATLREGRFSTRRGVRPQFGELNASVPYQFGQIAQIGAPTAERSRHKYEWSVSCSQRLDLGPTCPPRVENPALWFSESTREGKDFGST
jgi:hypothetical protein